MVTDPFIRSLKDSSFRYWQHLHDILRLLFDPVVKKPNRVNTVVNGEAATILITQPEHVRLSRIIISMGCFTCNHASNDYCRFSDSCAYHLFQQDSKKCPHKRPYKIARLGVGGGEGGGWGDMLD